ncbi:class A beta-lactamase-related serine hydrolase [Chryseobacterium indologenes]|uniref:serine hydrolase domain-containing protein n=2 Tax=Chryseobacterium indologenes TaxID=253 RepID=UPI000F4FF3DA|nr:serine hydrolase domain-containing protein [Chryseobacterium indologenes]AYZ34383.1 class A beta-lactamase-related serine hydrolase [Chryseobacterium indologenes]MBF6642927.1 beta-lactamase family protein [Chryseobacterium indologenes]MEB4763266.1 serine hydrolase [Chryseobacterium indologenes]QQQ73186.1 beta-lactamase family protein [Chryseobacterium indologenes]
MKIPIPSYIAVLLLFVYSIMYAQQPDHKPTREKLDEYFSALTFLNQFNGNIIIAHKGNSIFDKTYNMPAAPEEMKVRKDSRFIIASVSKVFVKYGILKLVEEKKISMDDKLSKFFPDFPNGDKITINHLFHHQSGLPREVKDYEKHQKISGKEVIEMAKKEKLLFEPGTKTLYSNIGFLLLHMIIDKVSANGYLNYIQDQIFTPMKLTHTSEYNDKEKYQNFAQGFGNDEGKIKKAPSVVLDRFETGNYVSTIQDLYLFAKEGFTGKYLQENLIRDLFDENGVLAQAGGRPGYRAYFYKNTKTYYDFVMVSNYSDIPIQSILEDVIKILDGRPYEIPKKIERKAILLSEEYLKKFEGKYVLEADNQQQYILSLKDKSLILKDKEGEVTELFPDSDTTFFYDPASRDGLEFRINTSSGKYELFIISTGLRLKAKRIE